MFFHLLGPTTLVLDETSELDPNGFGRISLPVRVTVQDADVILPRKRAVTCTTVPSDLFTVSDNCSTLIQVAPINFETVQNYTLTVIARDEAGNTG